MPSNNIKYTHNIHTYPLLSFSFIISFIMTLICFGLFFIYKKKLVYLIISIITSIISIGCVIRITYKNNKIK
jgi:hypothetical protein